VKGSEVLDHFRNVGQWVDWTRTCDQFLHGDPSIEVKGIAIAWIATNTCIKKAADRGLNLFITHEPIFYDAYRGTRSREDLVAKKKALLDKHSMTVLRCHDTWDRMPEVGIVDAWATFFGFETEPRPVESFFKLCLVGDSTVEELGRLILNKVRPLGEQTVLVCGDRKRKASRLAVGTGAITYLPSMYDLSPDVILATDDGINSWDSGLYALDIDIPLLIVGHSTAEKPGMHAMARYLKEKYTTVSVEYLDIDFPYSPIQ